MSGWLGDFRTGKTVRKMWNSNAVAGESVTRATNGTVQVYKDGGTTQSTAGVTDTEDFDGLTGVHLVAIDTSADGTFYSAGSDFEVVLSGATIDGKAINATLFSFSLENRSGLMPTTDGRKLDVSAGGEAGIDWSNIGSPTTTVGLSGTTVKTATDVETDTADIQARLPAALVSGRLDASVGAMASGVVTAAAIAADAITDAKVASDVTIASVTGSVGSVAGNVSGSVASVATGGITAGSFAAGAIDAAAIAANAIGASELAADAVAEIADAVWDEARSGHAGAGSFGEGVSSVQGNVTGSIGSLATQAKADVNAEADAALADAGVTTTVTGRIDVAVSSRLASAGYTAPLDAAGTRSAVGLAAANLDTQLAAIDDFLDTEIAAIKAKTDNLPASPAAVSDIPTAIQNADALLDRSNGVETGLTPRQWLRLAAAVLFGKASGLATTTAVYRDTGDTKDRITATVDADGNRSAVTRDAS